jgi:hypothetical protein
MTQIYDSRWWLVCDALIATLALQLGIQLLNSAASTPCISGCMYL